MQGIPHQFVRGINRRVFPQPFLLIKGNTLLVFTAKRRHERSHKCCFLMGRYETTLYTDTQILQESNTEPSMIMRRVTDWKTLKKQDHLMHLSGVKYMFRCAQDHLCPPSKTLPSF